MLKITTVEDPRTIRKNVYQLKVFYTDMNNIDFSKMVIYFPGDININILAKEIYSWKKKRIIDYDNMEFLLNLAKLSNDENFQELVKCIQESLDDYREDYLEEILDHFYKIKLYKFDHNGERKQIKMKEGA